VTDSLLGREPLPLGRRFGFRQALLSREERRRDRKGSQRSRGGSGRGEGEESGEEGLERRESVRGDVRFGVHAEEEGGECSARGPFAVEELLERPFEGIDSKEKV